MARGVREGVADGRYLPCSMTVLALGRLWLTEHAQPNLKPGAAACYRQTFYKHVAPELGMVRVDDCDASKIGLLLAKKRREGLSEAGVGKLRRHLHAMFAFAQDAGLVVVNPADIARTRGRRQPQRRTRGTQLSPVQIKRFLQECSPRWRAFFTVALDTGLRRGELIGLRWGDVELSERILHVRRSIGPHDDPTTPNEQDEQQRLTTKTRAGERLVPILDGAHTALKELHTSARDTSDRAPVFVTIEPQHTHNGTPLPPGRPLCPRMVSRVFRRYAHRAGLPETIRLHDLRHTAITNAISQGEHILLVASFAGHAKPSTTVNIYGHLMPDRVHAAALRIHSVSAPMPSSVA